MKFLFLGDVVSEAGRKAITRFVPELRKKKNLDFVIANIENLAGGNGITPTTFREVAEAGVDIFTGGNHTFDKKEGNELLSNEPYCLRPANYPDALPGKGSTLYTISSGIKIGVINVMGRTFMEALDCPFKKADELYKQLRNYTNHIIIDIHAEATSEKMAMAWYFDGRVTLVVGTHTHVQTADERILPQGTAYISDAGMTGPYDSVIGVKKEIVIEKFLIRRGRKFEPAEGDPWLCGVIVTCDDKSGRASSIERIRIELNRPETYPS